jgi:glucosamine kinase
MLLGAHGGKPGAIVAAGTGSIGEVLRPTARASSSAAGASRSATKAAAPGSACVPCGSRSARWTAARCRRLVRDVWRLWPERDRCRPGATSRQFEYAQLAPACSTPSATRRAQLLERARGALEAIARRSTRRRLPLAVCGSIGRRLPRLSPPVPAAWSKPPTAPARALGLIRQAVGA